MIGAKTRTQVAAVQPQLSLEIETMPKRRGRGGARPGAGRKKSKSQSRKSDAPHRTRPRHRRSEPVHVVLRALKDVPRLRRRMVFEAVRHALRVIAGKESFRIVHLSIQQNHLHFLAEADDAAALSHGMQSLTISLARQINRTCGRRGKVFAHRYHATRIQSPRQARNALAYVLNNWRHHREDLISPRAREALLDQFSSAISFDGWREATTFAIPAEYSPLPVSQAKTWLLTFGWKRHPAISCREVPGHR